MSVKTIRKAVFGLMTTGLIVAVLAVTGYSNGLSIRTEPSGDGMNLIVSAPAGFTSRVEIYASSNLVSGDWHVIADNLYPTEEHPAAWYTKATGFSYFLAGNMDVDSDLDGLPDAREMFVYKTNPAKGDTDADGIQDADELALGLDPKVADGGPLVMEGEADVVFSNFVDTADNWAESTGQIYTYAPTATDTRIGTVAAGTTRKYVMPFWIPDLEGKEIVGAALRMTVKETMGSWIHGANADLYGIRSDATSPTVTTNDCFGGTQLVDSWFRIENLTAGQELITTNSALSTWLNDQVGTNGQKYVFLAAQPDAVTNAYWYVTVHTGDATNAAVRPVLVLTLRDVIPPSPPAPFLFDDFSDGDYDVADGATGATWSVISGDADASKNRLSIGRPGLVVCDQQINAAEYTIQFDASVSWAENDQARFVFLRKNPTNYYWIGLSGTSGVYRIMNGVQTQLDADTNKLLQLSHDAFATNTFKIYVKNSGLAIDLKFDSDANWVDYDLSVTDSNAAAAALFTNTVAGGWDAGDARVWPDFHLDNFAVYTGLLATAQNPPAVTNQTVTFGSLTKANAGGAQALAADGTYQNFDAIVAGISGDTNNWSLLNGRLVSTVAFTNRSSAVLRCVASGSTCDVTIAIDQGAADVATPQEFSSVFTAGDHGGQRFYFRPDTCFDTAKIHSTMYGRMVGQSSEVVFGCRDATRPARMNYFYLGGAASNALQNLTFRNLHFVDTKSAMQAARRNLMMDFTQSPVNQPMARNIKIEDCVFEADLGYGRMGDMPYVNGDIYAIRFRSFAENISIRRNEIVNHGLGIVFGNGCRDVLIEENIFRLAWNDFLRFCYTDVTSAQTVFPDTERVRVAFNAIYDPVADNAIRHVDTVQTFQNTVNGFPGVMGDIELVGNLSFLGAEGVLQPPPLYPTIPSLNKPVFTNYTVLASDFLGESEASVRIDADTTSGPITVTLPDMSTVANYTRMYVAKISADTNPVTIVDPYGYYSTVVLTNIWAGNSYTKKLITDLRSDPMIACQRAVSSDYMITTNDFINGTTMATAWQVDTSDGPVTLYLPDMGPTPAGKPMTVSKISADTNPVIIRMAVAGQNISLKAAIDGSGETVTEYSLKSRWSGVYMSKLNDQTVNVSASAPNLAGFRIQRFYRDGDFLPYGGMAVIGNLMYVSDLLYRPESPVDNLVLAYNTGIKTHAGDSNGDGVVDIHDGYNPGSPETEWYYVTNGIRSPEAFGNISETFGAFYLSPTNGIDLSAGNLRTRDYTNDAQYEALFDVASADDLRPVTVQQALDLSATRSTGLGADYGIHQLINCSIRADGRGLTGTFKDNSAPAAPTATAFINGTNATLIITPNGTNAVHEYGSRVWYLIDTSASHTYKEITEQGKSLYVRGSSNEVVTAAIPASGECYLHMARRSINTQTVVSTPVSLSELMVPSAAFGASPVSGTAPLSVTFSDNSSGAITNRHWNFGDGSTTNTLETSLVHIYSSTGVYSVALTVSGADGVDTDTQSNLISVVHAPPVAGFSASSTSGPSPLPVTFTDSSSGPITNRYWNFGDGFTTNITGTSIAHTYTSTGVYTVALTASGPGGTDTAVQTNLISVSAPVMSTNMVIIANSADQQWSGTNSTTATSAWVGNPTATTGSATLPTISKLVVPFQLPALLPGHTISNVSLSVSLVSGLSSGAPQEVYVDVYAGRVATTSAAVSGDWGYGTQVGDNLAKISNGAETANTVKTGALTASYFQSIYDNDPNAAGKYIFLTLGPDVTPAGSSQGISWATANHTTLAKPTLTITTGM